jgi:hypothetical protein
MKTLMTTLVASLALVGCGGDEIPRWLPFDVDGGSDGGEDTEDTSTEDTETSSDSDTDSDTSTEDTDTSTEDTDTTDTETTTEDTDTGSDTGEDCPAGVASLDSETGLCWQLVGSGIGSKAAAAAYCDALVLGDLDDWRLTSKADHFSILSGCSEAVLEGGVGYCSTCAASPTCHELLGTAGDVGCYWLSDYAGAGLAWGACLDTGLVGTGPDVNPYGYVRCVRGG